ncbi:MAG: DUF2007 domain-containing protein [Acidobacteria bacterium]|nr:DUF2007 domain-containing protein [Acidobacteriota bacterium]
MGLKELYTAMGSAEAEVIKGLLEANGIRCLLRGNIAQGVYPFTVNGLGEIKVLVNEEDYERAVKIIKEEKKE